MIAEQIADDEKAARRDRLAALDFLAKYGLGTQQEVSADVTNRTVPVEWIKEA